MKFYWNNHTPLLSYCHWLLLLHCGRVIKYVVTETIISSIKFSGGHWRGWERFAGSDLVLIKGNQLLDELWMETAKCDGRATSRGSWGAVAVTQLSELTLRDRGTMCRPWTFSSLGPLLLLTQAAERPNGHLRWRLQLSHQ